MRLLTFAVLAMVAAATTLQQDETPVLAEAEESLDLQRTKRLDLCSRNANAVISRMDKNDNRRVTKKEIYAFFWKYKVAKRQISRFLLHHWKGGAADMMDKYSLKDAINEFQKSIFCKKARKGRRTRRRTRRNRRGRHHGHRR